MSRLRFVQRQQSAPSGRSYLASLRQKLDVPQHVRIMIRLASACLALYWIAIFFATHLPSSSLPRLSYSDKVYHAGAFAGLSFLLAWAIPTREGKQLRQLMLAGAIALLYACTDELTQKFIPGRSCDIWDVAADAVGIAIGLPAYFVLRQSLACTSIGRRIIDRFSH